LKFTRGGYFRSPQGRTAYFTTPHLLGGSAGEKNWRGEPTFPEAELIARRREGRKEWPLLPGGGGQLIGTLNCAAYDVFSFDFLSVLYGFTLCLPFDVLSDL
jgi:hypothetical protein